jgi:FkbM family methyltransferase
LKDSHVSRGAPDHEMQLVRAFFGEIKGYFVEVGASGRREGSQTWLLEQSGWTGVLVEPQPNLAAELRLGRKAKVFQERRTRIAASRCRAAVFPQPRAHGAGGHAGKRNQCADPLDSILIEAGTPSGFDFLSIDVEGHEIEVLRGFDIGRWRPRLILLEDHVADLSRHRYLTAAGYRIIRRYENNGWYVPRDSGTVGDLAQVLSRLTVSRSTQHVASHSQTGHVVVSARRTSRF